MVVHSAILALLEEFRNYFRYRKYAPKILTVTLFFALFRSAVVAVFHGRCGTGRRFD